MATSEFRIVGRFSRDVRRCVVVPSRKIHFPVDWRPLVEGRIANIGLPSHNLVLTNLLNADAPKHPILDTRMSVLRNALKETPLDSKTGWTGELWSKTNLFKYPN